LTHAGSNITPRQGIEACSKAKHSKAATRRVLRSGQQAEHMLYALCTMLSTWFGTQPHYQQLVLRKLHTKT
jgi:hypothetical protein